MKITNNYHSIIALPPSVRIAVGETVEYPDWGKVKDVASIAWHVDNGNLTLDDSEHDYSEESEGSEDIEASEGVEETPTEDAEEDESDEPADEKAALIASLAEMGVEVDGRTGVKKLRAMLDEALAQ